MFLSFFLVLTSSQQREIEAFNVNSHASFSNVDPNEDIMKYELDKANMIVTISGNGTTKQENVTRLLSDQSVSTGSIRKVTLKEGIIGIGKESFYNFNGMTQIDLPQSLKTIGDHSLNNCAALKTITIPAAVTVIETRVFDRCKSLDTINLPDTIEQILTSAFRGCESLTSFKMPPKITVLKGHVFESCINLVNIQLNDNLVTIEEYPFRFCEKLTTLTLPKNVQNIAKNAFSDCKSLYHLIVDENSQYLSSDGKYALYNKDKSKLIFILGTFDEMFFDIPATVKEFGDSAFSQIKRQFGVNFPDGITNVPDNLFRQAGLAGVELTNSITSIGSYSFFQTSLEEITLPNKLESIGDHAFEACANLSKLTLPSTLKSLGTYALSGIKIKALLIPDDITTLNWSVLSYCPNLQSVTFSDKSKLIVIDVDSLSHTGLTSFTIPPTVESLESAFKSCDKLQKISFPPNSIIIALKDKVFEGSGLVEINIPASIQDIGYKAFAGINGQKNKLAKVIFDEGSALETIGDQAFSDSLFTTITLPKNLISIGQFAFSDCLNLVGVSIPPAVAKMGSHVFNGCTALNKVEFQDPKNLTLIPESCFEGTGISTITIPSSVTIIGEAAFKNTKFISINIPRTISEIKPFAFSKCPTLESVVFEEPSIIKVFQESVFSESGLKMISIPDSVTTIEKYAFQHCYSLETVHIGANVNNLSKALFAGCPIKNFTLSPDNKVYSFDSGILYNKPKTKVLGVYVLYDELHIAETVTNIDNFAFSELPLTKIHIPKLVTTISANAFYLCSKLSNITFENPLSIKEINGWSFSGTNLSSFNIPASITNVGVQAFANTPIKTLTCDEGVKIESFKYGAFENTSIEEFTVPLSFKKLEEHVFNNCTKLERIVFPANTIVNNLAQQCLSFTALTELTIPNTVKTIERWAFRDCNSLEFIRISKNIETFGEVPFFNTLALKTCFYCGKKEGFGTTLVFMNDQDIYPTIYVPVGFKPNKIFNITGIRKELDDDCEIVQSPTASLSPLPSQTPKETEIQTMTPTQQPVVPTSQPIDDDSEGKLTKTQIIGIGVGSGVAVIIIVIIAAVVVVRKCGKNDAKRGTEEYAPVMAD